MKQILQKVVSTLQTNDDALVVERGEINLGKRLMAWWQGRDLVTRANPGRARSGARTRSAKTNSTAGHQPRIKKPTNDQTGQALAPEDGKPAPAKADPASSKKKENPASLAARNSSKMIRNSASPVRDMDMADLLEVMWDVSIRTPGGIKGAVELIEPIIQNLQPFKEVLDILRRRWPVDVLSA